MTETPTVAEARAALLAVVEHGYEDAIEDFEAAVRAEKSPVSVRDVYMFEAGLADGRAESAETLRALRELLREAVMAYHQLDNIRDHADPNVTTGWVVGPIETCRDLLCVDSLAALAATPAEDER